MNKLAIALLALAFSACATIRAPLSSFDDPLGAPDAPIVTRLELQLEASSEIPPAEQAKAAEDARMALSAVASSTTLATDAMGAADPLLVVRERAVARTESRRSDQLAAKIGIVVGIVVVVAAIAVGVKLDKDGHGSSHAASSVGAHHPAVISGASHGAIASGSRAVPVHMAGAAPVRGFGVGRPISAPRGGGFASRGSGPLGGEGHLPRHHFHGGHAGYYGPAAYVDPLDPMLDLDIELGIAAAAEDDAPYGEPYEPEPAMNGEAQDGMDAAGIPPGPGADDEPAPPAPPPELTLPDMPPFLVEDRGFFDGDIAQLQLDLFDRADGRLLWSKLIERDIDARDVQALGALFRDALAKQPWARPRD